MNVFKAATVTNIFHHFRTFYGPSLVATLDVFDQHQISVTSLPKTYLKDTGFCYPICIFFNVLSSSTSLLLKRLLGDLQPHFLHVFNIHNAYSNTRGRIIREQATDLSSTSQTFSLGFTPCTAPTSHSRNQRVLLPVNRRFPRHSSTPTPRNHISPISTGRNPRLNPNTCKPHDSK